MKRNTLQSYEKKTDRPLLEIKKSGRHVSYGEIFSVFVNHDIDSQVAVPDIVG